jgi:cation transport ATPase
MGNPSNGRAFPMSRLAIFIFVMVWVVISGTIITAALSLGYYGWVPIALGVIVGALAGVPIARRIASRIKRRDPDWDQRRDRPVTPDRPRQP